MAHRSERNAGAPGRARAARQGSAEHGAPAVLRAASWIWPDNPWWDLYNCFAQFRKVFVLSAVPKKAMAYVTADQSYRLWVNGAYVTRGPARGFQHHWPFDEVDLAPLLRPGENVIAVRAYNPGVSCYQYVSQGQAGFLFGMQAGAVCVVSDTSWKSRRQAGVQRDAVPVSIQLFPQEIVDARREPEGWTGPGFDDGAWKAPLVAAMYGGMPWPQTEPRMLPQMREELIEGRTLAGVAEGASAPGYALTRDVASLRAHEGLEHAKPPASGASTPRTLVVEPMAPGRYRSFLVDFGKTVVGTLELSVDGAAGGEIIDALYTETIDAGKLRPDFHAEAYCRMAFGGRLVCRPGATSHAFYHIYGFRWLTLTVRDAPAGCRIGARLRLTGYPLARSGRFQSSDPVLEAIWETCAWTQQCCSLDGYIDTPWREQAQWWGDAEVQGQNTFFLSGDTRLLRRGIDCIARQRTPDNLTYGHSPTIAHNCILPDFTLAWMRTLWDYWWQTGSLEAFRAHADTAQAALGYFAEHTDRGRGLVAYDPRYWLFLDWTGTFDGAAWTGSMFKEGYSTVYNLQVLLTLAKMAELQKLARMTDRAAATGAWERRLRGALARLVDPATGLVHDGYRTDGRLVTSTSVHSQVLALMAGLPGIDERAMLDEVLLPSIRGKPSPHVQPSVYWCTYLFAVLAERGYGAEVVDFIRRRWEPMIAQGSTVEIFDPFPGDSSRSHAWSAHPLVHLMQIIGGIRQAAPGWTRIRFAPTFLGDRGGATVPTPNGNIRSEWKRKGKAVSVALALPPRTTAQVILPGARLHSATGKMSWTVTEPPGPAGS